MTTVNEPTKGRDLGTLLHPYLPRLTLDWLADYPERTWIAVDGAVVFVDISGFTKLSEKLAKAGKVGAEEMADAINKCFTELLAVAYGENGSLLKFGGDALLILFADGQPDECAARAVRAAAGMRRRLREVGKIATSRGTVGLRMSVGVHSGTFHFFLVGDSHRELIVAGPGTSGVVEMEGTADAGEICLSPAIAALLPPRCVGAPKGPGYLLKTPPSGSPRGLVSVVPDVEDELVERCIPVATREELLAGAKEPEHRQVSVAFLHYDGTDELLEREGPAVVAAALDELVRDVQAAVDDAQVCFLASDVDHDGGKIILTAGVPRAVGDDEERMLLALRRIADGERKLHLRIGVNHGPVFAGDIGPRYRRTYTVMGDTVNLAARLMAKAPPGEIYATGGVLDLSGTRFETTEIEPFMVKGKAKPVQAWALGQAIGSRTREAASHTRLPLVGRDEEIEILEKLALAACSGTGHLVEIVGEPGVGKTRLLEELGEREYGLRILHATAEAYTSSTPYAIWRELLRGMLGVSWDDGDDIVARALVGSVEALAPKLMPWLPLLADAFDVEVPTTPEVAALAPEFRRPKLHEVMGRFLSRTLADPTLIQIEDVHLMDTASSELLSSLVSPLAERPWLIAVARRNADTGFTGPEDDNVVRLSVAPLSRTASHQMVVAVTEEAPLLAHDEELVEIRSGGNPQFLLDLVRALESGSVLPDSVEAAATARIDSLAPIDRTIVRRAAIFGVSFHPRLLADVLDAGTPRPDERTWERLSEFFEDDGDGYRRFRRAVVRDAAYEGLPFRTRRRLHAVVGTRLEGEMSDPHEAAGILSLHFFLAGEYAKSWGYANEAAAEAAASYANVEAARLYQRAIDSGRRLPEVSDRELGSAYYALGKVFAAAADYRRAKDAFAKARRLLAGDPIGRARVLLSTGSVEDKEGRYSRALAWVHRAITALTDVPGDEAARSRATATAEYAELLVWSGRMKEAIRWASRAMVEALESQDRQAEAQAHFVLGWADVQLGRPATDHLQAALDIYVDIGDQQGQGQMLVNVGYANYMEGRWHTAVDRWQEARVVLLKVGNQGAAATCSANIGEVLMEQGRLPEADPLLAEAIRVYKAARDRWGVGSNAVVRGTLMARLGRFDQALQLLHEARDELADLGGQIDVIDADARIAECRMLMGQPELALEVADDALVRVAGSGGASTSAPLLHRVRGYSLAQQGRFDEAREALLLSIDESRARSSEYNVAFAGLALARLASITAGDFPSGVVDESEEIIARLDIVACVTPPMSPAGLT